MQLLSEIDVNDNEHAKNKLAKLAELHESIVNDVAKDTRAIKLEAECNELRDKYEMAQQNYMVTKEKYSKLKRDCYNHKDEIERVVVKYNKLKEKLNEMKEIREENQELKEELMLFKKYNKFNTHNQKLS